MPETPNMDTYRKAFPTVDAAIHFEGTCLAGLYGPMPDQTIEILNGVADEAMVEMHYAWLLWCLEQAKKEV